MMMWTMLHPAATMDRLGFTPEFLNVDDPRPAAEQFDENYAHGGGWRPFKGFTVLQGGKAIQYPGDPALPALAMTMLHGETIMVYVGAWVAIFKQDGTVEIGRMD